MSIEYTHSALRVVRLRSISKDWEGLHNPDETLLPTLPSQLIFHSHGTLYAPLSKSFCHTSMPFRMLFPFSNFLSSSLLLVSTSCVCQALSYSPHRIGALSITLGADLNNGIFLIYSAWTWCVSGSTSVCKIKKTKTDLFILCPPVPAHAAGSGVCQAVKELSLVLSESAYFLL